MMFTGDVRRSNKGAIAVSLIGATVARAVELAQNSADPRIICGNSISVYLCFMPESRVWSGENLDYPGIDHSERIVREIQKPNGDKITIFESGSTVIHKVGMLPRTRTPEGVCLDLGGW